MRELICDLSISDVKQLNYTCKSIIKVLSKQSPLHKEAAILSRFLYKFDKKFRNDIGYRNLRKVNTALKRYLAINFLKDVETFTSVLPKDEEEIYLPTRQMIEYVLVRLITFAKIMLRVGICSKQAAIFYLDRVKRGESHWMSLMPYSLLSRIWSMSVVLIQHSCNWFSNLYPFLDKLTFKGLPFLPESYYLPNDLEKWLDLKNIESFGRFEWSQKKTINFESLIVEDGNGDTTENIMKYVELVNKDESLEGFEQENITGLTVKLKDNESLLVSKDKAVDHGVVISRNTFNNLFKTTVALPKIHHYAERVTNKDTLQQFISTEEKMRNEENGQSLTDHLSFMQWQALKTSLVTLLESLSSNKKIEKKFQKVWKEKCLHYK